MKLLFYIITIPMAGYLFYRLILTDELERADHILMLVLFALLIGKQIFQGKKKNSETSLE